MIHSTIDCSFPGCGARAGDPCEVKDGKPRYHKERGEKAKRLQSLAESERQREEKAQFWAEKKQQAEAVIAEQEQAEREQAQREEIARQRIEADNRKAAAAKEAALLAETERKLRQREATIERNILKGHQFLGPLPEEVPDHFPAQVGVFVVDGYVIRVRPARNNPQRRYVDARYDLGQIRIAVGSGYIPGLVATLRESQRITPAQIQMFEHVTWRCSWCGRAIRSQSMGDYERYGWIQLGMGPVCHQKYLAQLAEHNYEHNELGEAK